MQQAHECVCACARARVCVCACVQSSAPSRSQAGGGEGGRGLSRHHTGSLTGEASGLLPATLDMGLQVIVTHTHTHTHTHTQDPELQHTRVPPGTHT